MRRTASLAVLALWALAGCTTGDGHDLSTPGLTRAAPQEIEAGGTLELTGHALDTYEGRDLTVVLSGDFVEPGGEVERRSVRVPAEYGSAGRVFATFNRTHVAALGARTLRFQGSATLTAEGPQAPAPLVLDDVTLELFPPNVQRAIVQYDVWRSERAVSETLGLHIHGVGVTNYETPLPGGVLVLGAQDGARRKGLLKGDRLVALNGAPIRSFADFRLAALDATEHAHYVYLRGEVFDLEVPSGIAGALKMKAASDGPGVIVTDVQDRSPAWLAGIQTGDRLVAAAGAPLDTGDAPTRMEAAAAAIAAAGETATLTTWRGDVRRADLTMGATARLLPPWLVGILLLSIVCTVVLLGFVAPFGGIATFLERRIAGRMQSRIGPNRVGPQGLLQFLADGVKLLQKEDLIPGDADPILFRIAPYLVFLGVFLTFAVLPFSSTLVAQNLNIGVLYVLSVTSLVVVGILMSGWASNNKWSLLGGMRSSAQIVSYEIPASLSALPVVLTAGSLSMQEVIRAQGGMPWEWNLFAQPALFICFFIFFVSALAEGNRTPFDLAEAESELVSGYNTEYSGMRFSMMALGEFANIYVMAAIAVTLFLGGWRLPTVGPLSIEAWRTLSPTLFGLVLGGAGSVVVLFSASKTMWRGVPAWYGTPARVGLSLLGLGILSAGAIFQAPEWLAMEVLRLGVFQGKALALVFVVMWIRWTLPRLRVDQMMNLCWKYFVPFTIGAFLFTTLWIAFAPEPLQFAMLVALTSFGAFALFIFVRKVVRTFRATRSVLYANPFV